MTPEAHFRATAPRYMKRLAVAFPELDDLDLCAIFGNAGHESLGLTDDQEDKPVVKGSRGGANWMQWTGPRRRALEAFAARQGLDPMGDEAAYQFLVTELRGSEHGAIAKVKEARGLKAKVIAFEKAYLRAGVKHYDKRLEWAEIAANAYRKAGDPPPAAAPATTPAGREQIEQVQAQLRALGYSEVGAVDGIAGPATENAILIFRKDNGLPLSTRIDDPLLAALMKAKPRVVSPARADAPAAVVREQAPEAHKSWLAKVWSNIAAAFSAVTAGVGWLVANLGEARAAVKPITDVLGQVPVWAWLGLLALGFVGISRLARGSEKAAVNAYRTGERR